MIEMDSKAAKPVSVGVIADDRNHPVGQYFDAQFKQAAQGNPDALRYDSNDADSFIQSIGHDSAERFRRYGVVIAAIGIPTKSMDADYRFRMNRLLGEWGKTGAKSVILLAVEDSAKAYAKQVVDSWNGWESLAREQLRQEISPMDVISDEMLQQKIDMLKNHVRVNTRHMNWEASLADIGECVQLARKQASIQNIIPSSVVVGSKFKEHPAVKAENLFLGA